MLCAVAGQAYRPHETAIYGHAVLRSRLDAGRRAVCSEMAGLINGMVAPPRNGIVVCQSGEWIFPQTERSDRDEV